MAELSINGATIETEASSDTPLLYVLTDELLLQGPRFGCGLAQCGSCSVLVDGVETRACITPIETLAGKNITTLEGITQYYAAQTGQPRSVSTPLQDALVDEQAIQCGYCYNGMIIKGTDLLLDNPDPSDSEIRRAMNGHLCRCGTYPKILSAIKKASRTMLAGIEQNTLSAEEQSV
jgi:aerobic-type carbon monoxide dehydrogenase small subunit (CoxS/CutS family)